MMKKIPITKKSATWKDTKKETGTIGKTLMTKERAIEIDINIYIIIIFYNRRWILNTIRITNKEFYCFIVSPFLVIVSLETLVNSSNFRPLLFYSKFEFQEIILLFINSFPNWEMFIKKMMFLWHFLEGLLWVKIISWSLVSRSRLIKRLMTLLLFQKSFFLGKESWSEEIWV